MPNDPSPLVGRASVVSDTARRARAGQGTAFTGPPGSGGSRLLDEVQHAPRRVGARTALRAEPVGAAQPLREADGGSGPWRESRRPRIRYRDRAAAARLVAEQPRLAARPQDPGAGGRPARRESDRTIATALGITLRTAQTHLSRALAKLGIRRRTDLPTLIGEP